MAESDTSWKRFMAGLVAVLVFGVLPFAPEADAAPECAKYSGDVELELATGEGHGAVKVRGQTLRVVVASTANADGTFTQRYKTEIGITFTVREQPLPRTPADIAAGRFGSDAVLIDGGTGTLEYSGTVAGGVAEFQLKGRLCGVGPDVILAGGVVHTVAGSIEEAVAIEDGRIIAVGSDRQLLNRTYKRFPFERVDLAGHDLVPAFVDAHSHVWEGAASLGTVEDDRFRQGVTTQGEPTARVSDIALLEALESTGHLRLRTRMWLAYNDFCGRVLPGAPHLSVTVDRDPARMFSVLGTKIFSDGGACNAPAISFDYSPGLDPLPDSIRGDSYLSASDITTVVNSAVEAGHQVVIHAIGDVGVDNALLGLDGVLSGGSNPDRHRVDHNVLVQPARSAAYVANDIGAVIFGEYETCRHNVGGWWGQHLGPAGLGLDVVYPWRRLADDGVRLAWQADIPSYTESTMHQWYGLTTLGQVDSTGAVCDAPPLLAANALTVNEALEAMTINAAHALHLETEVGSIEVGKAADLVILSRSPFTLGPSALMTTDIAWTMTRGIVVYCNSSLSPVAC